MSNRKLYFVHLLAVVILGTSYFVGTSFAAPAIQRRDDGDSSFSSKPWPTPTKLYFADSQQAIDVAGSPSTTYPTMMPSVTSSSVTPTPTSVEHVPPVTILKQLGTTAVVAVSQGKTTTISIPSPSISGLPSPTSSSNQANSGPTSDGVALKIPAFTIGAGFAVAMWVLLGP